MAQAGQKQVKLTDLQPQQLGSLKEQLEAEVNALVAARCRHTSCQFARICSSYLLQPMEAIVKTCFCEVLPYGDAHGRLPHRLVVTSYLVPWPPPTKSEVTRKRYIYPDELHRTLSLNGRAADTVAFIYTCHHFV